MSREPKRPAKNKRRPIKAKQRKFFLDDPEMIWNRNTRVHAESSGLSFSDIAKKCPEIGERRLRRLLNGKVHLRVEDAVVLGNVLGKRLDVLVGTPEVPEQRRAA